MHLYVSWRDTIRRAIQSSMYTCLLIAAGASAQDAGFTNPILPGGYPDPSICRVGDDFYIVNSSFEYFPGLPIHHSKDLVNWELVGYGLHRKEQVVGAVNLVDVQSNGGIHAPTLRCRDGKFYIITTNVYSPRDEPAQTQFVNFIITADSIDGPWSEPRVLEGAPGIDPDIFFDSDGKVWYVGTHSPDNPNFPGEGEIWLQEIDLHNSELTGRRYFLWRGACGGTWAEGPHIYKRDGRYYLMVAEGGTSFNHAMMIAVSDEITGPYTSNARNPILSTRQLSYDNWVNSTGHADMVELVDGRWYMVALGIRGDNQRGSNMGRETHLLPLIWEREPFEWKEVRYEWPVVAPHTGRVERFTPLPFVDTPQNRNDSFVDNFDTPDLGLEWNFRRVPIDGTYSLSAREGHLRLYSLPAVIQERGRASLMGFRQKESRFEYVASMRFSAVDENVEAGISLFQKDDNFLNMTVTQKRGKTIIGVTLATPESTPTLIASAPVKNYAGDILLKVQSDNDRYRFSYSMDNGQQFSVLAETTADLILSKGYTGAYLGLFSSSNGQASSQYADFDWVEYRGFPVQ